MGVLTPQRTTNATGDRQDFFPPSPCAERSLEWRRAATAHAPNQRFRLRVAPKLAGDGRELQQFVGRPPIARKTNVDSKIRHRPQKSSKDAGTEVWSCWGLVPCSRQRQGSREGAIARKIGLGRRQSDKVRSSPDTLVYTQGSPKIHTDNAPSFLTYVRFSCPAEGMTGAGPAPSSTR